MSSAAVAVAVAAVDSVNSGKCCIIMETYESEENEQEKPLLQRGHEDKLHKGEKHLFVPNFG